MPIYLVFAGCIGIFKLDYAVFFVIYKYYDMCYISIIIYWYERGIKWL